MKLAYKSEKFLPGQREMMQNLISGRHFISRLPVGGGKSACWTLTAVAAEATGLMVGSTLVVVPYVFLGQHHLETAKGQGIDCVLLTAGEIKRGSVPKSFANGVPSIVFMTVDTFSRLLEECADYLKLCIQRCMVRRIVIDEAHLPFLECNFRDAYESLRRIIKTLLGIQLIALSGTLPRDLAVHLTEWYGMQNPIIQDCDDIGLENIPITVSLWDGDDGQVVKHVSKNLKKGHIHIFGQTKGLCKRFRDKLRKIVDPDVNVFSITGGATEEEKKQVMLAIQGGKCHVLLTTTCALVGFENKLVRSVLVLGFLYNVPSVVQAAGRLRPSQREGCDCTFLVRRDDLNIGDRRNALRESLDGADLCNKGVIDFVGPDGLVEFYTTDCCRLQILQRRLGCKQSPEGCGTCDNCKVGRHNKAVGLGDENAYPDAAMNCGLGNDNTYHNETIYGLSQPSINNFSHGSIGTFRSEYDSSRLLSADHFSTGKDGSELLDRPMDEVFAKPLPMSTSPLEGRSSPEKGVFVISVCD